MFEFKKLVENYIFRFPIRIFFFAAIFEFFLKNKTYKNKLNEKNGNIFLSHKISKKISEIRIFFPAIFEKISQKQNEKVQIKRKNM